MVRTQIQLTDEQAAAVRRLAGERGLSMAALIRDVVDRVIAESDAVVRDRLALAAVGRHSSGRTDVAVRHDAYLTDTA